MFRKKYGGERITAISLADKALSENLICVAGDVGANAPLFTVTLSEFPAILSRFLETDAPGDLT